jgi:hypothetical protein
VAARRVAAKAASDRAEVNVVMPDMDNSVTGVVPSMVIPISSACKPFVRGHRRLVRW